MWPRLCVQPGCWKSAHRRLTGVQGTTENDEQATKPEVNTSVAPATLLASGWATMLWCYHRGNTRIDLEIRKNLDRDLYEIVISYPDGSEDLTQVEEAKALIDCVLQLQSDLMTEGWKPQLSWGLPQDPAPSLQ